MVDRREKFRQGLHPLYIPLYDELGEVLGPNWQPTCGIRSFSEQAALYACGRSAPGHIITQAAPGLSFHNYGLASDWDYFPGGKYTPLAFGDPRWLTYIGACSNLGLRLISWEKPHNEYAAQVPVREILCAYNQGGIDSVTTLLQKE